MLGADIIGFHIQFHCNNFLETVDRFLESKIDWEHFSVTRGGHATLIKPFPISVDFELPSGAPASETWPTKEDLLRRLGVEVEYLGVGVDRIDYTKGIPNAFGPSSVSSKSTRNTWDGSPSWRWEPRAAPTSRSTAT